MNIKLIMNLLLKIIYESFKIENEVVLKIKMKMKKF